jgi:hypothetical protein
VRETVRSGIARIGFGQRAVDEPNHRKRRLLRLRGKRLRDDR